MLSYKRSVRVAELIQQQLSKIIQDMSGPDVGLITITGVKLTDDLLDARVYYSVLGSEEQTSRTNKMLLDSTHEIRRRLAQSLNLRRTPSLLFDFDSTPEKATKIFEILEKIKTEPGQNSGTSGTTSDKPASKNSKKIR